MMNLPSPEILGELIEERQERLRPQRDDAHAHESVRVRIGHALIAAGTALSGERTEHVARRSSPRPA